MFRVGMYRSAGWCFSCGRQTVMVKPRVNHLLHLALSVVTLGLWLLVWAALGFRNSERPPYCESCGTEADSGPMPAVFEPPVHLP